MNIIDIVLLVIALIALIAGWRKGLINAIGGLLALLGGLLLARLYAGDLTPVLHNWWPEMTDSVVYIIAFVAVFIGGNLVISLLAWLVEKIIKALFLGWVNRLCGALMSVLIATFMMSIVLNVINFADPHHKFIPEAQIEESILHGPVISVLPMVVPEIDSLRNGTFELPQWNNQAEQAGQKI